MQNIIDRFLSYVTIDTESDASSPTTPSTKKQLVLANLLAEELNNIGLSEVTIDEKGYVMGTLPSNVDYEVPVIGFVSHYDTSPDFSGANVKPQIVTNYDGRDIVLNAEKNIVLSPSYFDDLLQYKGQTLITTDGTTLLGADDKAGLTEIVTAMEFLKNNPQIKHGKIRVGFTPDEEIGRGADFFDVEKFGADWAYTMDGSQIGELEYENFNAAGAKITFKGKSVHPGYAKGKMINSMMIAHQFIKKLPKNEIPQETQDYEGFFHVTKISGTIEETIVELIIRDHDRVKFEKRKKKINKITEKLNKKFAKQFGEDIVIAEVKDQYYNMLEKVAPHPEILDLARKAYRAIGVEPEEVAVRGGTDGSRLSFMGLPTPNLFTGGYNYHGRFEYLSVEELKLATQVIVEIARLATEGL